MTDSEILQVRRDTLGKCAALLAWICCVVLFQIPVWEIADAHPEMRRYFAIVAGCSFVSAAFFFWVVALAVHYFTQERVGDDE